MWEGKKTGSVCPDVTTRASFTSPVPQPICLSPDRWTVPKKGEQDEGLPHSCELSCLYLGHYGIIGWCLESRVLPRKGTRSPWAEGRATPQSQPQPHLYHLGFPIPTSYPCLLCHTWLKQMTVGGTWTGDSALCIQRIKKIGQRTLF